MSYIGAEPDGKGQAERFIFTATSTSATITHDDAGLPIGYKANHVSVYLNGVKQIVGTDVTASNGSTVVFASNLVVDDVVEVIALSTFAAATTEGTSIQSTGETGNVKFLGEDGDNSSSWKQVDSGSVATGAIDLAHMSSESVDEDNLHISNAGSNGEFLSKQSGNAGGLTWAAAGSTSASDLDSGTLAVARMAAGTVIQTVFDHDDTITNFGHDTSYVDIGGSDIAITPTSTSSKILYVMNVGCQMVNNNNGVWVQILRGSTSIRITKIGQGSDGEWVPAPLMIATIDSPSTTSATTYKCKIKVGLSVTDDDNARINPNISSGNKGMFIMAQEIAG